MEFYFALLKDYQYCLLRQLIADGCAQHLVPVKNKVKSRSKCLYIYRAAQLVTELYEVRR